MKLGLVNIPLSTAIGTAAATGQWSGYITDASRKALGMAKAELGFGIVDYRYKQHDFFKRAAIQSASQFAYATLRSYPRFIRYWEQQYMMNKIKAESTTSLGNSNNGFSKLIEEQKVFAKEPDITDVVIKSHSIPDYIDLSIKDENGKEIRFTDPHAMVDVSGSNNVILTQVQGRDFSRKEFISGGDYRFTIKGKIASRHRDVFPEAEMSLLTKILQSGRVIDCNHTVLRQFKITQLIILDWEVNEEVGVRNIVNYSLKCVAVEPSEAIEVKLAIEEQANQEALKKPSWIKVVKFGTDIVDPSSLLTLTKRWL